VQHADTRDLLRPQLLDRRGLAGALSQGLVGEPGAHLPPEQFPREFLNPRVRPPTALAGNDEQPGQPQAGHRLVIHPGAFVFGQNYRVQRLMAATVSVPPRFPEPVLACPEWQTGVVPND